MTAVTVSGNGQVVIPAAIRRNLGIKPGTELDFELEGSSIRISMRNRVSAASIASGYGMLKAGGLKKGRKLMDFDAALALRENRAR